MQNNRIIVIGGGLAGLAAATFAARQGASVTLLERSSELGGRAATHEKDGFSFNEGAHALYANGPADRVLEELGITYTSGQPNISGAVLRNGRLHTLPAGVGSLITTSLLTPGAKLEAGNFLRRLAKFDPAEYDSTPVDAFVAKEVRSPVVRGLMHGLFRLSTYSNAPARISAGTVIRQFQMRAGVHYIDGGWQTLVGGLEAAATAAGVEIVTSARVSNVVIHEGAVRGVTLGNGLTLPAESVIVAGTPSMLAEVAPAAPAAATLRAESVRARVAVLDVGLSALPVPERRFAISADEPMYFSMHAPVARLAPDGHYLASLARYIPDGEEPDAVADLARLEGFLDLLQPGWREFEVTRQFLPDMVTNSGIPLAERGGQPGRPGVAVPGVEGLFVAGDWVGPEGLLADTVLSSAKSAALAAQRTAAPARAAELAYA